MWDNPLGHLCARNINSWLREFHILRRRYLKNPQAPLRKDKEAMHNFLNESRCTIHVSKCGIETVREQELTRQLHNLEAAMAELQTSLDTATAQLTQMQTEAGDLRKQLNLRDHHLQFIKDRFVQQRQLDGQDAEVDAVNYVSTPPSPAQAHTRTPPVLPAVTHSCLCPPVYCPPPPPILLPPHHTHTHCNS